ncbi:AAA-like domain-containing protein [Anabaena sp. CCY 9910]|uniref:WD40 domain-containing protein n=1 Tax=Anabaena sp. CCY 9910 TaxID=3103870 RepID=UPI0039E126F1
MKFDNYYKVGGSLNANHRTYVSRKADAQIFQLLKTGEYCFVFNSRQMGKSSLRVQAIKKFRAIGIKCASIDLTILGGHVSPEKWYKGFANQLLTSLEIDDIDFNSWWLQHDSWTDVQRLNLLFESLVLNKLSANIIIFIDEIDTLLKTEFKDDFFALIRACYNQRAESPKYERLTFCLLGVATPGDLIKERERTPFNIGSSIELTGFSFVEAKEALIPGLADTVEHPEVVLQDVLHWTGGQPFLTQKLCSLIAQERTNSCLNVNELVNKYIINNWETQDEPEHLRTIRDRLLRNEQKASRLLGLYQQVLHPGVRVIVDSSQEQTELRLSGLVVKKDNYLKVYNPIYQAVFNQNWIEQELDKLRPYSEAINNWLNSQQEPSCLLQGKALDEALTWAVGKNLSNTDYEFLQSSQKITTELQIEANHKLTEVNQKLADANEIARQKLNETNERGKQQLAKANQKAMYIICLGGIIATILVLVGQNILHKAEEAKRLTQVGYNTEQQFKSKQFEALLSAMKAVQDLKPLVYNKSSLGEYQTTTPLSALLNILVNIHEYNQFDIGQKINGGAVSFSPDGELIAFTNDDRTIDNNDGTFKLWNRDGTPIKTLSGHKKRVKSLSLSHDSQFIASASDDGTIKLWKRDGTLIKTLVGHQRSVVSVSFSSDNTIVSASIDGTIKLWQLNGNLITTIPVQMQSLTTTAAISPNGEIIAVGSEEGNIELWNRNGTFIKTLSGNKGWLTSVTFSPDGETIAAAIVTDNVGTIKLWKLNDNLVKPIEWHTDRINTVRFSPNSKFIASGSSNQTIKLWQLDGTLITLINTFVGHSDSVTSINFNPDGKAIASVDRDGKIKLWRWDIPQVTKLNGHQNEIGSITFNTQANVIATSGNGTIKLWQQNGSLVETLQGYKGLKNDLGFSPDGKTIVAGMNQGTAKLWRWDSKQIKTLPAFKEWLTNVSFSPDGKIIAFGTSQGNIQIWKQGTPTLISSPSKDSHKNFVTSIAFSPDGKTIASGGDSDDRTIKLWHIDGTLITTLNGHRKEINSISFSPDGEIIASASADQTIKLWQRNGKPITTLTGHNNSVTSVSFSTDPDGKILASGSYDTTIKLWKRDGTPITTLTGHSKPVTSLIFSPDGKTIVSASEDGKVILWNLDLDHLLAQGCQWLQDYFVTHPGARDKLRLCN